MAAAPEMATPKRWFEDFVAGEEIELGERTLTTGEIVDFAREFDPQSFHLDEEAARAHPFGGLVASGLHTMAIWSRLFVDAVGGGTATLGGSGFDEVRFLKPVRPGAPLRGRVRIVETRPSQKSPERGLIHYEGTLVDTEDESVLLMRMGIYLQRRPAA
jgi:acyl dehydratase